MIYLYLLPAPLFYYGAHLTRMPHWVCMLAALLWPIPLGIAIYSVWPLLTVEKAKELEGIE